ncbi:flagellar hook protein FlgE [Thioalkalivibrio halophilus]|uniref:Flagellar hook protein FlgE n=1 Tax=Thioalkalivibrio halophilus TaxID=252474 RepID=A0A1V3A2H8_9GAMM|nr:flagellar hook protein FlgE [Thioalkalivibrio halophilus]OOC11499.1 flagellar hook protein FlgE [Thioalkalivibrio halophilus]
MPFNIGLSGLNSAQADLDVTGNNVANAGTTGFKQSRAEFGDVYAQSFGGTNQTTVGAGSRLLAVTQQFSQGQTEFTENGLDLAIDGEGFFQLDDRGNTVYSRAGEFQVDREGFIVNSQGQNLQGYIAEDGDAEPADLGGTPGNLRLDTGEGAPRRTEEIDAQLNLRSDAEVIAGGFETDNGAAVPDSYNFSTSLTVYNGQGEAQDAEVYFTKVDDNEWEAYVAVNGEVVNENDPKELVFDANGELDFDEMPDDDATFTFDPGDAFDDGTEIEIDFAGTTQYGTDFGVSDLSQDGYAPGTLTDIDIDNEGVVFARYSNGQSDVLGQVVLANFDNPQGLEQLGNNNWAETFASGGPTVNAPGAAGTGLLQAGALEASNVDIAQELVNLITAQRNFQANSQTISTADTVTQTIINIR